MLYIFPCSVSLPSQSVQLLFTFFCFQSSIQIIICMSLCHCNCLLCLILLFFVFSFFFLVFSSLILFHAFFTSSLLCSFELPHSTTMSPCLLFISQMSLPVQYQLFFLAFLPFCPTHQVTHPCLPKSWSPLV